MLQEEVLVAPGLEHGVIGRVHAVASPLEGAVEMLGVLQKGVVGGEVGTTAKPPHRTGFEIAVIEMNGGDVGVAGVQHHRGSNCIPGVARRFRPLVEDRRGQVLPLHLREIHTALLEQCPLAQNPGATAATFGAYPALLLEATLPIELLQPRANAVLQPHQQGLHAAAGISRRGNGAQRNLRRSSPTPFQLTGAAGKCL